MKILYKFFMLSIFSVHLHAVKTELYDWPYQSAGVLPSYQVRKTKYLILGRNTGTNEYSAFGGVRLADEKDPIKTAARTAYNTMIAKKTIGMTDKALKKYLASDETQLVIASKVGNVGSVAYITNFSDHLVQNLLNNFYAALQKATKEKYKQKDRLAIVRWDDLEKTVRKGGSYVLANTINPQTHKREPSSKEIKLDANFTSNLSGLFKKKTFTRRDSKVRVYDN